MCTLNEIAVFPARELVIQEYFLTFSDLQNDCRDFFLLAIINLSVCVKQYFKYHLFIGCIFIIALVPLYLCWWVEVQFRDMGGYVQLKYN